MTAAVQSVAKEGYKRLLNTYGVKHLIFVHKSQIHNGNNNYAYPKKKIKKKIELFKKLKVQYYYVIIISK